MLMKCKVVYNFQSIEFDYEISEDEEKYYDDMDNMMDIYEDLIERLKDIAPEQPKVQQVAPKEAMASDKQIACLVKLGVDEKEAKKMTAKQAFSKIKTLIGE